MIYFEGFFLIVILGLQFYFFNRSRGEISFLRNFFPTQNLNSDAVRAVEYYDHIVEQLNIQHSSKEFDKVVSATNSYLIKNKGSADFNIIKSIADRSVEAQENKVASTISLPLYLGLMGTFIGVILGLTSIAVKGFDLNNTDLIIKELITGVVLAMMVSLFGLALTTILNAFLFKDAIADRDINRNLYFNFLQVELLPNLDNNLYSALDSFKSNISDFNDMFANNLKIFDSSFNENIKNLKSTVVGMSTQIQAVNENTSVQLEFLQELRKIGYNRMAEANIKVFDKIKEAGPMLVTFIKEQQKLTQNLEQANSFGEKITDMMNRVSSFEDGINHLGRDIQQSDLLGADVLNLVRKHLDAIGQKEAMVQDYASRSNHEVESYFADGLERIKLLKRNVEVAFENAFNFDAEGNLMQNLKHLKVIDQNVAKLNIQINEQSSKGIEDKLDNMTRLLEGLITTNGSKVVPSIEERLVKVDGEPLIPTQNLEDETRTETNKIPVRKWYHFGKRKSKA